MQSFERAKTLLGDEFFLDVVKKQREGYISLILNSAEDDVETRERSIVKVRALDEFMATLESISKEGEILKKRLKFF
jgi:uncharacterized protein (DUF1778 family)